MTENTGVTRIVTAGRDIAAPAGRIFELIADPAQQPRWDGNNNLGNAMRARRVVAVGEVFVMTTTTGNIRDNHVVEFDEGRRIAWMPADVGQQPAGHLWRWELDTLDDTHTRVVHTYDWSRLADEKRMVRARSTTVGMLRASLDRLAALSESEEPEC